jgi:hypothetical protein
MKTNIHQENGFYTMPLPFNNAPERPQLPNNRNYTITRLMQQKKKFKDRNYYISYKAFMDTMIEIKEAIKGPVKVLRSDQGSNFVGASNEFARAYKEMQGLAENFWHRWRSKLLSLNYKKGRSGLATKETSRLVTLLVRNRSSTIDGPKQIELERPVAKCIMLLQT